MFITNLNGKVCSCFCHKVHEGKGGAAPLILKLGSRCRWVVISCLGCSIPPKKHWCPLDRRLVDSTICL